jgi:hypothetical protein
MLVKMQDYFRIDLSVQGERDFSTLSADHLSNSNTFLPFDKPIQGIAGSLGCQMKFSNRSSQLSDRVRYMLVKMQDDFQMT